MSSLDRFKELSPQQQALLMARLKQKAAQRSDDTGTIAPVPRTDTLPLSFAQQRMWFLWQLEPTNPFYNMPGVLRLSGTLDVAAFERTLNEVVRRHETLRTTFPMMNDAPVQRIAPNCTLAIPLIDLSALSPSEAEAETMRRANDEARRPFDLAVDVPIRATFIRHGADEHVLLLTLHHIASDGWSLRILVNEVATLYAAFLENHPSPLPDLAIQYADFAHWQRQWLAGEVLERQLNYWRTQLRDAPVCLNLPSDFPRPEIQRFKGARQRATIAPALTVSLRALARASDATLYMVLLAAFDMLLARYSGETDLLVGSPIANRNRAETEALIGFFVSTLIMRTDLAGDPTFRESIARARATAMSAYAHQDIPFEHLVDALNPARSLSHTPFFQVFLALQNASVEELTLPGVTLRPVAADNHTAKFDLSLYIIESQGGLALDCEYATDLFKPETIEHFLAAFESVLTQVTAAPETRLSALTLPPALTTQAQAARARDHKQTLAIAATFSAEPIEESLGFWMKTLERPSAIHFAPYNQVFQELLNPASTLGTNQDGLNVILLRLEDWLRFEVDAAQDPTERFIKVIGKNTEELIQALTHFANRPHVPTLITICPASTGVLYDTQQREALTRAEQALASAIKPLSALYLITPEDIAACYPLEAYEDFYSNDIGHVPYTPQMYGAVGTVVARRIDCLARQPYKVIVLDADNTLWRGVVGEAGPQGVNLDPPYRALHEFMLAQHAAGMLLCLASKNSDADVREAFEQRTDFPLRNEHFIARRVNWEPKSKNLKALAHELQLGLDSFIFIDDNPVECAEVAAHCPQVLTLQLPTDVNAIPGFLQHVWAFDHVTVTADAAKRHRQYEQNKAREEVRQSAGSFERFIESLELKLEIAPPTPEQRERVAELTQRTNQFNLNTRRRDAAEIQRLCAAGDLHALAISVKDRFGDYGLTGVAFYTVASETLAFDTFLLSCRVLGRGVEHRILAHLATIAVQRGCRTIEALYLPTPKNKPIRDFLESIAAGVKTAQGQGTRYCFPAAAMTTLTPHATTADATIEETVEQPAAVVDRARLARFTRIAQSLHTLDAILTAIRHTTTRRRGPAPYLAPRSETERALAAIWADVLKLDQVGVHDHFQELGGHSLLATQVVSRIRQNLNVELPLRALFEAPTLDALAARIETLKGEGSAPVSLIPAIAREGALALSFAQQRLWFLAQLEPESPFYNMPGALTLRGNLDLAVLTRALNDIVHRHETLRTTFVSEDGQPVQRIAPAHTLALPVTDLSALEPAQAQAQARRLAQQEAKRPFDLAHEIPIRVSVIRLNPQEHLLLFTLHHIAGDGWSLGILTNEVAALYGAYREGKANPLPALPIQYADFADWQRRHLSGARLEAQLTYWTQQLKGAPALLELPSDFPRPAVQGYRGARYLFELNNEITRGLRDLAQQHGTTLYVTLLAAFNVLLSRYSGQDDITVGSIIANRNRSEIEHLIGFFANTLVMRNDVSGNPRFTELVARTAEVAMGAYAHQDLPFEHLLDALNVQRNPAHSPLFQVSLTLQNAPTGTLALPGLEFERLSVDNDTTPLDLIFHVTETDAGLRANVQYNTDLFRRETIEGMARHLDVLLRHIVREPTRRLSQLPLLAPEEQQRIVFDWNAARSDSPEACVHWMFEYRARKTPNAVAVVIDRQMLTYAELNLQANQLAHYLRTKGVGPDKLVGLCVERSFDMIVGLLGILKAGGAYLPLDPAYPRERLAYMLSDAAPLLVLTQDALRTRLPSTDVELFCLDSDRASLTRTGREDPASNALPSNLAYVIYTSGSTGQPKGVAVSHASVSNLIHVSAPVYGITPASRMLQFVSLSFDVAVEEIFMTLARGAALVLPSPVEGAASHQEFLDLCRRQAVSVTHLPTAYWHQLVDGVADKRELSLPDLNTLILGGDSPQFDKLEIWENVNPQGLRVFNAYGPTETTVAATVAERTSIAGNGLARMPIGRPLANTRIYILDAALAPTPVGVPGEIYIGGPGVARGYLNRPDLTAERFIPNPYSKEPGARLYRSGDRARYLSDGNIEFLGRVDHQVKIRGFRIELGEIETTLLSHSAVKEAVVLAREDSSGDKRLVAYIVGSASAAELKAHLQSGLPEHMLPSAFVMLDALPLGANGKLDRNALPAPDIAASLQATYVAPRNGVEEMLCQIWASVLKLERVGIHDNFFELGGHSLLATQVVSRIREAFSVELPLRDLFR